MPVPVKIDRQVMPAQAPASRISNFKEVALGFAPATAEKEAGRCLQCAKAPCRQGCPVGVDIPAFIGLVCEGNYEAAIHKIKEKNNLPAVCGRVCPQESQCEKFCTLGKKQRPVSIGGLERFVADWAMAAGVSESGNGGATSPPSSGKRVAVVGSGPAGVTAAADLARAGHAVSVFEALHIAGGVLVYGIPEFRLPKNIVQYEIDLVGKLGVELRTNTVIGSTYSIDELFCEGYDAVFLGTGAGLPHFMNIPGENLNGVYSANEFLTRVNLMKAYLFPDYLTPIKVGKRVAVVGAGNVAMDAARTALRLGAREAAIVYRRSEEEMPARKEEIEHAREEGVQFHLLTSPVQIVGDDRGWVRAVTCVRYKLGEPDESGRRRPVAISGSEYTQEFDTVVMAIGQGPNPLVTRTTPGLETNRHGNITVNAEGATSRVGVFAGGDIVTGAATVISAMGAGKLAAEAIDKYLRG